MLYAVICKKYNFILLETNAEALSVLSYKGVSMIAITTNQCVITESAVAH